MKPTNKQLFLHYRSNHQEHVFKAIVYNQALLAVMVCSHPVWTERYLGRLRTKFLEQEYPASLIDDGFEKAKKNKRTDLIFQDKKKKDKDKNKKRMRNCLCVTLNPGNPPFQKWIKELLPILHRDKELKKLIPSIPLVAKQPPNVASMAIRAKHWKTSNPLEENNQPGCIRHHQPEKCVCCSKMEEKATIFKSSATGRQYKITRTYDCLSRWVVYVVTCTTCNIQYVGQTTQEMRKRHYGHRSEVRSGMAGLGSHFHDMHGMGLDLKKDQDLNTCLSSFRLTIVASVKPPSTPEEMQTSQAHLDRIEADLQHRLKCMDEHGGMNRRDENDRKRRRQV